MAPRRSEKRESAIYFVMISVNVNDIMRDTEFEVFLGGEGRRLLVLIVHSLKNTLL